MKKNRSSNYQAYLLRLWRENEHAPWRATLEDARTKERLNFASVKRLIAFLEELVGIQRGFL